MQSTQVIHTAVPHVQVFNNAMQCLSGDDRELPAIQNMLPMLQRGIAVHHSGLLPILKEVIEVLFQEGLIKVGVGVGMASVKVGVVVGMEWVFQEGLVKVGVDVGVEWVSRQTWGGCREGACVCKHGSLIPGII